MIKASIPIHADIVDQIENNLHEIAPSKWIISQSQITLKARLEGYFENNTTIDEINAEINSFFSDELCENNKLEVLQIKDTDWTESYKIHFKPWNHKGFHWIPIWLVNEYLVPQGDKYLLLDPGMAFGTGNHETTKLCLEEIVEMNIVHSSKQKVLDIGCGSGILAITAAKLGYLNILGIDNDEDAVRISEENAILNQVEQHIRFKNQGIELIEADSNYDLVVANIQSDILIENKNSIIDTTKAVSTLLLSGVLAVEAKNVEMVYSEEFNRRKYNYKSVIKTDGEWSLIRFSILEPREL